MGLWDKLINSALELAGVEDTKSTAKDKTNVKKDYNKKVEIKTQPTNENQGTVFQQIMAQPTEENLKFTEAQKKAGQLPSAYVSLKPKQYVPQSQDLVQMYTPTYKNPYWGGEDFKFEGYGYTSLNDIKKKYPEFSKVITQSTKIDPRISAWKNLILSKGGSVTEMNRSPEISDRAYGESITGFKGANVAEGGTSGHNYGKSIDISIANYPGGKEQADKDARAMGLQPIASEGWHYNAPGWDSYDKRIERMNELRMAQSIPALMQQAWEKFDSSPHPFSKILKGETQDQYVDRMVSDISTRENLNRVQRAAGGNYDFGEVMAAQAQLAAKYYDKHINDPKYIKVQKIKKPKTKPRA